MIGKQLQGDGREQFLAQTTPILQQQMVGMTAGQREQFARQYGLDLDAMQTALGDGGNFGDFFGSLGGLTQQELLTQGLTIDQLKAFNRGTFLTPQSAGVAGVTGNAMPFQSSYNQFDIRQRNPDLIQI